MRASFLVLALHLLVPLALKQAFFVFEIMNMVFGKTSAPEHGSPLLRSTVVKKWFYLLAGHPVCR